MAALTEKSIAKLIAQGAGRHRDVGGPIKGLFLQTSAGHSASWLLRFERGGRERWCGLGGYPLVSLKMARERARDARLKILDGQDPIDLKRQARAAIALEAAKAVTFAAAARQYYESHERKWSAKHAAQWQASIEKFVLPKIGALPVASIDTGLVLKCIETDWSTKTETMSRTRNRIESVLDWASVRNLRTGDNPARWKSHLEHLLASRADIAKPVAFEAMPYPALPVFLSELRQQEGTTARALELLILCASRAGEIIGAVWSEVDLQSRTWTIPAERMKAAREHSIPLNHRALEILQSLPREADNPFIFIGARGSGISPTLMRKLLRRMGVEGFTVHGFRSSFRMWAGEQTAFPPDVIEHALAHAVGSGTERSYARSTLLDKRRRLMEAWAAYCSTPAATDGTVLALRKA